MSVKRTARLRRAKKTRKHVQRLVVPRLSVHKTNQHTYAQVIDVDGATVLAQASSMDKELAGQLKHGANVAAATAVGALVAKRAASKGVGKAAFDRSGNRYHGRVKALADAAREGGLIE